MDDIMKRLAFKSELRTLRKEEYITEEYYNKVDEAYNDYCLKKDIENKNTAKKNKSIIKKVERIEKEEKILSPQEVKERNITMVLIIGVAMVLISGIILGTTNWSIMSNGIKTGLIMLVAALFFGISIASDKILKISKTSFAFWILGSLFLPVVVLSAGYFELLGSWLSISGEGKYILGVIGSTICLPVYIYSVYKYENRLFAWVSLITLSIDVIFLIASLKLPIDGFYFGIAIYNLLLLLSYIKLKNNEKLKIFINEIPTFIQANLVLSTLCMLIIFSDHKFYGFNIILTAIVYMVMVYTQNSKYKNEYIYTSSALLIYGLYQIIEYSFLANLDILLFSMVGFVFLGLEKWLKNEDGIKKIFCWISGFVSFCAFVFISFKGMVLRMENPSLMLMFSYIIISLNYIYLLHKTKRNIFSWLSSIFIMAAGFQSCRLIQTVMNNDIMYLYMFSISFIMFFFLYYKNKWEILLSIKKSSCIVSVVVMILCSLYSFDISSKESAFLFYIMGITGYLIDKSLDSKKLKIIIEWIIPICFFIGNISIMMHLLKYKSLPNCLEISICVIFIYSVILKKYNKGLAISFLGITHMFLPIIVALQYMENLNNPILFIIPMGIYVYGVFAYENELKIRSSLYLSFIALTLSILSCMKLLNLYDLYKTYSLFISSIIIFGIWFRSSEIWKERISNYIIIFSSISVMVMNVDYSKFIILDFTFCIISSILVLYVMHNYKVQIFNIIPLTLMFISIKTFNREYFLNDESLSLLTYFIMFFVLKIIGEILSDKLYENNNKGIFIDWYSVFAFFYSILIVLTSEFSNQPIFIKLISWGIIPYLLFSQVKRIEDENVKRIVLSIGGLSILGTYYALLRNINLPEMIKTELYVLVWIPMALVLSNKVWNEEDNSIKKIEYVVLIMISLILLRDIIIYNNTLDALILGVLSLISVIYGFQLKEKSFFGVGAAALVLNVLIQTKTLWSNIPWWGYLLITGLILIITASINEAQKNKKDESIFKISKDDILDKFKDWK